MIFSAFAKIRRISTLCVMTVCAALCVNARSAADFTDGQTDSINRAIAAVMANSLDPILTNLTNSGLPVNRHDIGRYITEALTGADIGFTSTEGNAYVEKALRQNSVLSPESQKEFLAKAASEDGAIITPSGLVFRVIVEGEGVSPTLNDKVGVKYVGKFSDGTVFDDTGDEIVTLDLGSEIPGFVEGLQMMKPGGTYRIVVPGNLAYGEEGIPGIIPGNAALDFIVTLESVAKSAN